MIERSAGMHVGNGYFVGDGYKGETEDLDKAVQKAAEFLSSLFTGNIEIRFNHNRESGGAYVKDKGWCSSIGISASQFTRRSYEAWTESAAELRALGITPIHHTEDEVGKITFAVGIDMAIVRTDIADPENWTPDCHAAGHTKHLSLTTGEYTDHDWTFESLEDACAFVKTHCFGYLDGSVTRRDAA